MDLGLTPDDLAFRDEVRAFVRAKLPDGIRRKVTSGLHLTRDEHVRWQRILNERGYLSGEGRPFHAVIVQNIRRRYGLQTRYNRLRKAGMPDTRRDRGPAWRSDWDGENLARPRLAACACLQRQEPVPVRASRRRSTGQEAGNKALQTTALS